MKLNLSNMLFAAFLGATSAEKGTLRRADALLDVTPSMKIENTLYLGKDFGMACGKRGSERVEDKTGAPLVYCFKVTNTGNTHLQRVVITNAKLDNFIDNSIGSLAPGQSKMVAAQSTITGGFVNHAVVSAIPVDQKGQQLEKITASDSSEVVDAVERKLRALVDLANVGGYSSIGTEEDCIQTKWEANGKPGQLVCSESDVYLASLEAIEDATCVAGETIFTILKGSIALTDTFADIGWYVDGAGGEAMTGSTCVVNGLREGNEYDVFNLLDPTERNGHVEWLPAGRRLDDVDSGMGDDPGLDSGGNDGFDDGSGNVGFDDGSGNDGFVDGSAGMYDECGDVIVESESGALVPVPVIVAATMSCKDTTGDGKMDVGICFTYRYSENDGGVCTFSNNIPATPTGGCYCTRVKISNVIVTTPDTAGDVAPC